MLPEAVQQKVMAMVKAVAPDVAVLLETPAGVDHHSGTLSGRLDLNQRPLGPESIPAEPSFQPQVYTEWQFTTRLSVLQVAANNGSVLI